MIGFWDDQPDSVLPSLIRYRCGIDDFVTDDLPLVIIVTIFFRSHKVEISVHISIEYFVIKDDDWLSMTYVILLKTCVGGCLIHESLN